MSMPKFSDPSSFNSLPMMPPFYFENMTTRVLPLRASLGALQNFVDNYLNFIPPDIGRFQVMAPYVMLMMIDYGKLAMQVASMGWLAQREVMFGVPVAWYSLEDGEMVFRDIAWATPFIFVDSDIALTLGRQVYGWPKLLGRLTPELSRWMRDPRADISEARLSTPVFRNVYAGEKQTPEVFLEVRRSEPIAPLQIPIDIDNPLTPWSMMENMVRSFTGSIRDVAGLMAGLGIRPPHQGTSAEDYVRMSALLARMMNPYDPDLVFNTINLKQFRDSGHPENYCYQSLTSACMKIKAFHKGGLLGDLGSLAGDSSGGYRVLLHEWPSLPITATLGLQKDRSWQGDGAEVSEMRPVFPFWYEVDMSYERGHNAAWRSFDRIWYDHRGKSYRLPTTGVDDSERIRCDKLYNGTLGASSQTVAGPFEFTDSTVHVLPLLADKKALRKFLYEYLNRALQSSGQSFELWCSDDDNLPNAYVYLIATNYGSISSGTDNIGNWATEDVTFFVPVKWKERGALRGVGLVPVFTYVGDTTSAISGTEVLGWPTTQGFFERPTTVWLSDPSPAAHQSLLSVTAEVMPALGIGQQAVRRPILEIHSGEMDGCENERLMAEQWATMLSHELERKKTTKKERSEEFSNARALALEILAREVPYNVFTMKQFRDVFEPDKACYQSIVRIPRTIRQVKDLREMPMPIHVRIKQYPSQPIVDLLGLKATLAPDQDGGEVYLARPVRPFWMKIAWREDLGQRMWYRCGTDAWEPAPRWKGHPGAHESVEAKERRELRQELPPWEPYFPADPAGLEARLAVHKKLGVIVDDGDPRNLKTIVRHWIEANGVDGGMTLKDAVAAVEAIDPQMVIEAILAREWENWDSRAHWKRAQDKLNQERKEHVVGAPGPARWVGELSFFEQHIGQLKARRAAPPVTGFMGHKLDILKVLGVARAQIEEAVMCVIMSSPEKSREKVEEAAKVFDVCLDRLVDIYERASNNSGDLHFKHVKNVLADLAKDCEQTFKIYHERGDLTAAHAVVEIVRNEYKRQRGVVVAKLAKADQVPDFYVPRDIVGAEKERLFPSRFCWGTRYVGPEPKRSKKKEG